MVCIFPVALVTLWLGVAAAQGDNQPRQKPAVGEKMALRQATENRLGRPDRVFGVANCLLCFRLETGDTLTFVLADEKVVGIEHSRKADLKDLIGKRVTLVGVYNGRAKANDQVLMPDGQFFWLQDRNDASRDGEFVSVTGVVKYFPGTHGPAGMQGIPKHYYMEADSIELKVLYPFKFRDR